MILDKQYILINEDLGEEILLDGQTVYPEPTNWNDSEYTYKRSTKNLTESRSYSKNIEFTSGGKRFIDEAFDYKYIEAKVKLIEKRLNAKNEWRTFVSGYLDFSEIIIEKTKTRLPFNVGGLQALIKNKLSDKLELERTTDLDGNTISEIQRDTFNLVNRPLDLNSELKVLPSNNEIIYNTSVLPSINWQVIPLSIDFSSDERVTSAITQKITDTNQGLASGMFYLESDRNKVLSLDIQGSYDMLQEQFLTSSIKVSVALIKYETTNLTFKEIVYQSTPKEIIVNPPSIVSDTFNYVNNVSLLELESLALVFVVNDSNLNLGPLSIDFTNIDFTLKIQQESTIDDISRVTDCYFNKNIGEQLARIITGKEGIYYSNFFDSSDFKYTACASGKAIRGFDDYKTTISIKDYFQNTRALFNMFYNYEEIDNEEVIRHEPLEYFFRNETVIQLPNNVRVTRKPANDFIYNTIETGYKKPDGDNLYEEVSGLNEYNVLNTFTTPITKEIKVYDNVSPFRADSEGKELTFRRNKQDFPTEDYRTDKNIFNLDLKLLDNGRYAERTYIDDFSEVPQNIYSPETATGLRITPARNIKRHFNVLKSSLLRFPEKSIRYASTKGNSDLITKVGNETEIAENGNFLISNIDNAIFVSEWLEFEHVINVELMELINGFQFVENTRVPNTYYKIAFKNENQIIEYGYLFELRINNNVGKFKILKTL